jgi:thymidine phosphorylase
VRRIDALQVGMLGRELGIGRATIASAVEHGTGFRFVKKIGDRVSKGEVLAEVLGRDEQAAQAIAEQLRRCITVGAGPVRAPEVVLDRIAANREKTGRA